MEILPFGSANIIFYCTFSKPTETMGNTRLAVMK